MKRVSVTAAVFSALSLFAAACSSDPTVVEGPAAAGNPSGGPAGASAAAASSDSPVDAACDKAFDAMLARIAKCGPGSTMNLAPVERSRTSFKKLCTVQGSRPGTGYTAAFRTSCADALATAGCADDDAVVKACWEPRGELARGLPCNTDDQCKDGLCELPSGAASGSSCGVCGTPVWKQEGERCNASDKDKCEPATRCDAPGSSTRSCRSVLGRGLGEACGISSFCRFGLTCDSHAYACAPGAPRAAVGEACESAPAYKGCELGAVCDRAEVCVNAAVVDEHVVDTGSGAGCDSWTTESATGKCIVKEALACN